MTGQYKVISDNLGEYNVVSKDNVIVATEIQNRITAETFCEELNILAEENEQLKRQVGNLEHTRDFCADVCADCERLEQENKEFKQRIKRFENYKKASDKFTKEVEDFFKRHEIDTVNFDLIDGVFDGFEFYSDKYNELKKENKELKKRDDLVSSYLQDEGSITLEKYEEIVDYLYKEWKKKRDLND